VQQAREVLGLGADVDKRTVAQTALREMAGPDFANLEFGALCTRMRTRVASAGQDTLRRMLLSVTAKVRTTGEARAIRARNLVATFIQVAGTADANGSGNDDDDDGESAANDSDGSSSDISSGEEYEQPASKRAGASPIQSSSSSSTLSQTRLQFLCIVLLPTPVPTDHHSGRWVSHPICLPFLRSARLALCQTPPRPPACFECLRASWLAGLGARSLCGECGWRCGAGRGGGGHGGVAGRDVRSDGAVGASVWCGAMLTFTDSCST